MEPPSSSEEPHQAAEKYKTVGNRLFQDNKFEAACQAYSRAIDLCENNETLNFDFFHIYLCNRAQCHIKLENYGLAILDADRAISAKPGFSKAYYRRGCAYAALCKLPLALKDFESAYKLKPESETLQRVKECQKEIRHQKFAKAIRAEPTRPLSEIIDVSLLEADLESYSGPKYRREPEFLPELLQYIKVCGNSLHKRYAYEMVLDMTKELQTVGSVVEINVGVTEEFTVCGDIHGQFYDLLNIFEINGLPSETNPYLFNGDFVDRGSFSVECILALFAAKLIYPKHVHLARGNHETRGMNKLYGFQGEVASKYDNTLYELFCECFCWLPLAHMINKKVFIVHGGLFAKDGVTIADIAKVDRNTEPLGDGVMTELLWSDPQPEFGRSPSKRGVACSFGPDVTNSFLEQNKLDYIIRSHEMKEEGYSIEHSGKLITVFSAPNYCDSMNNQGAFIRLRGDTLKPRFTQFHCVPHPEVPPMQFANPLLYRLMGR